MKVGEVTLQTSEKEFLEMTANVKLRMEDIAHEPLFVVRRNGRQKPLAGLTKISFVVKKKKTNPS